MKIILLHLFIDLYCKIMRWRGNYVSNKKRFNEEVNRRMDEEWQRKEFYDLRDKIEFLESRVKDLTIEVEDLAKYIKDRNSDTKKDEKICCN